MGGIVLELQNEIIDPNCDVVNALRRAHLIATKLNLLDFDKWIMDELNGYSDGDACPEYRKIRGALKGLNPYNGWIPTMIPNIDIEKLICEKKFLLLFQKSFHYVKLLKMC